MIELRILGEIQLLDHSGAPVDALLRQPKRLALLAYLASPAPGTWHRRDMLLALFWPELDTAHARTSLRNALYVLRQTLGDDIIRTRGDEEISIDPDAMCSDLAAVWDALRNGRPNEALERYGGELLPGLIPPDSDGFIRWLDTERARLKVAISASSMAHTDSLERKGDLGPALAIARHVMRIEPHDETVVRRVMSLHEVMGDRAGALAAFESYRSRLASDFDAEPAPETLAIANRLRAPASTPPTQSAKSFQTGARVAAPPEPALSVLSAPSATSTDDNPPALLKRSLMVPAVVAALLVISVGIAWSVSRPVRPLAIGSSTPLTADEGLQVEAAVSPNGRLVAFAKGNSSRVRILIQKIDGGPAWPLTGDSTAGEILPRWSPDNDQLLFLSRYNAYVAPSIGGTPRLVAKGTVGDGMIRSAAWSPAGDSVAIVRNDSLMVQPLVGTGARLVGVGTGRQLHSCVWSPRTPWIACMAGNWLAFEAGPLFGNEAPSAIVLYPAGGGKPIDVTGNASQYKSPAWSADGRFLWMISDRDGSPGDVYAVAIGGDGHPTGPFVRIGLTAESIGLSANRIAYSVPVRRANIWSVPIAGDEVTSLPRVGTRMTSGTQLIELVSVSPDRKWLVFDSNLHGNADIFRMPIAGGSVEQLTSDPRPEYSGDLSPDGRELLWHRWVNGERHLFVKQLDSDSAQEIIPVPGDQGTPHWSPDGQSVAAWSHNKEAGAVFVVRRDARGTWKRPAWRLEGGQLPVWSRDGRTIAFIRYDGGISTISADSGVQHSVYAPRRESSDPIATQLNWSIDPETIWFIGSDTRGRGGIWSVPARGGSARMRIRLDDPSGRAHGPGFSTDGSRFYFTLDERFSNVRYASLVRR